MLSAWGAMKGGAGAVEGRTGDDGRGGVEGDGAGQAAKAQKLIVLTFREWRSHGLFRGVVESLAGSWAERDDSAESGTCQTRMWPSRP